jgi:hypothetical protein
MNFYVIFEGGTIGVYDFCSNCRMLVFNDNSNNYQIYKDSDEVGNAWEVYCKFHGFSDRLSSTNTYHVKSSNSEIPPQSTIFYNVMVDPELYN